MCGLRNEGAQKWLLSEADLSLTKALTVAQIWNDCYYKEAVCNKCKRRGTWLKYVGANSLKANNLKG